MEQRRPVHTRTRIHGSPKLRRAVECAPEGYSVFAFDSVQRFDAFTIATGSKNVRSTAPILMYQHSFSGTS